MLSTSQDTGHSSHYKIKDILMVSYKGSNCFIITRRHLLSGLVKWIFIADDYQRFSE
ncbi:hypothetical protein BH11BAC5_BH11BAC5_17490 [soil metagenome]